MIGGAWKDVVEMKELPTQVVLGHASKQSQPLG